MRKNEAGFTLIELLVVITILGFLFGLVALNLTGFAARGKAEGARAELDMVQTAVDVSLAQGTAVPTMAATTVAIKVGPATPGPNTFSTYLRRESKYLYWWNNTGTVLQATPAP